MTDDEIFDFFSPLPDSLEEWRSETGNWTIYRTLTNLLRVTFKLDWRRVGVDGWKLLYYYDFSLSLGTFNVLKPDRIPSTSSTMILTLDDSTVWEDDLVGSSGLQVFAPLASNVIPNLPSGFRKFLLRTCFLPKTAEGVPNGSIFENDFELRVLFIVLVLIPSRVGQKKSWSR
jgi:hypothetical protein